MSRGPATARRRFRPAATELRARPEAPVGTPESLSGGSLRRALVTAGVLVLTTALGTELARDTLSGAARTAQGTTAELLDAAERTLALRASTADELRAAEAENERLRLELQRMGALEREHRRLAALLALRETVDTPGVGARVIARPGGGRRVLRLDAGTERGIGPGDAVLTPDGIAGQVVASGGGWADVLAVTDGRHALQGTLAGSGAHGTVIGTGDGLAMAHVLARTEVAVGELVTASGEGGVFPAGVPVGRVASVTRRGPFLEVALDPVSPPDRAGRVLVLAGSGGVASR